MPNTKHVAIGLAMVTALLVVVILLVGWRVVTPVWVQLNMDLSKLWNTDQHLRGLFNLINTHNATIRSKKMEIIEMQKNLTERNALLKELRNLAFSRQKQINTLTNEIGDLNSRITGYQTDIDSKDQHIKEISSELSAAQDIIQRQEEENTIKEDDLVNLRSASNATAAELRDVNGRLQQAQTQMATMRSDISNKTDTIAALDANLEQTRSELAQARDTIKQNVHQITSLQNRVVALVAAAKKDLATITTYRAQIAALTVANKAIAAKLANEKNKYGKLMTTYRSTAIKLYSVDDYLLATLSSKWVYPDARYGKDLMAAVKRIRTSILRSQQAKRKEICNDAYNKLVPVIVKEFQYLKSLPVQKILDNTYEKQDGRVLFQNVHLGKFCGVDGDNASSRKEITDLMYKWTRKHNAEFATLRASLDGLKNDDPNSKYATALEMLDAELWLVLDSVLRSGACTDGRIDLTRLESIMYKMVNMLCGYKSHDNMRHKAIDHAVVQALSPYSNTIMKVYPKDTRMKLV